MNLVFLVGASRSGTTWLQLLLSQSSRIATCQETHLFSGYLKSFSETLAFQSNDVRSVGLRSLYNDDELLEVKRLIPQHTFSRVMNRKQGADIVLEKTPDHVHCWREIVALYPDARFIHLVRDPRSVVASMRATGAQWGNQWADAGIASLSRNWVSAVSAGQQLVREAPLARQVRYENIAPGGAAWLQELWAWLGVTESVTVAQQAFDNLSFESLAKAGATNAYQPWNMSQEPRGMWRKGDANSWREELTRNEIAIVEAICGEKMSQFDYSLHGSGKAPVGYKIFNWIETGAHSMQATGRTLFKNLRKIA